MLVLMMAIMNMAMIMFERFVRMFVAMRFGQVQPEADRHQDPGDDERYGDRFAEHRDREQRTDERCRREISSRPSRAEVPKREHEHHEADAVPKKADQRATRNHRNRWQGCAKRQRQDEIDGPRGQPFQHRDLDRIGTAELSGEIIVDTPGEASAGDRQHAQATARGSATPR